MKQRLRAINGMEREGQPGGSQTRVNTTESSQFPVL